MIWLLQYCCLELINGHFIVIQTKILQVRKMLNFRNKLKTSTVKTNFILKAALRVVCLTKTVKSPQQYTITLKMADQVRLDFLCRFYHEPSHT